MSFGLRTTRNWRDIRHFPRHTLLRDNVEASKLKSNYRFISRLAFTTIRIYFFYITLPTKPAKWAVWRSVILTINSITIRMPIQPELTPPELLFSVFASWLGYPPKIANQKYKTAFTWKIWAKSPILNL